MAYKRTHCGALILNVWGQAKASNVGHFSALHSAADPFLDPCAFSDFSNMNMKKASGGAFGEKKGNIYVGGCGGATAADVAYMSMCF